MTILVKYSTCDGYKKSMRCADLYTAQKFAQELIGETPEVGRGYAVSFDGIGIVTVQGATLAEIFPKVAA
jgi:hypothetical protein